MPPASGAGNAALPPSTAAHADGLPPSPGAAPPTPGAALAAPAPRTGTGTGSAAADPPASHLTTSGPTGPPDPVLAAERDHLPPLARVPAADARERARAARDRPGTGCRRSTSRPTCTGRAEALRDLPDVPLFFGQARLRR